MCTHTHNNKPIHYVLIFGLSTLSVFFFPLLLNICYLPCVAVVVWFWDFGASPPFDGVPLTIYIQYWAVGRDWCHCRPYHIAAKHRKQLTIHTCSRLCALCCALWWTNLAIGHKYNNRKIYHTQSIKSMVFSSIPSTDFRMESWNRFARMLDYSFFFRLRTSHRCQQVVKYG